MTNKTKKIAVIPLKKDSQRLNNKNFLKLGNIPLWEWTLNCLNDSNQFDHIIISTDSEEILSIKKDFKDNVFLIDRPNHLNHPHAIEVVFHSLKELGKNIKINDNDIIFMALPTSPFRKKKSVIESINIVNNTKNSVVGVTRANKLSCSYRLIKNNFLLPVTVSDFNSENLNVQSTDVDEYVVTASIYASIHKNLIKYKTFHQPNTVPIVLNEIESIDVNSKLDFSYCQFLINHEKN